MYLITVTDCYNKYLLYVPKDFDPTQPSLPHSWKHSTSFIPVLLDLTTSTSTTTTTNTTTTYGLPYHNHHNYYKYYNHYKPSLDATDHWSTTIDFFLPGQLTNTLLSWGFFSLSPLLTGQETHPFRSGLAIWLEGNTIRAVLIRKDRIASYLRRSWWVYILLTTLDPRPLILDPRSSTLGPRSSTSRLS